MINLLYELIPICPADLYRLIRWMLREYVTLLRLVVNLLIVVLRVIKYIVRHCWLRLLIFTTGFWIFNKFDFGHLWIILTGFAIIYLNLSTEARKPGELSAYSVFNEGFQRIMGDLDAEQIDQQLRRGG